MKDIVSVLGAGRLFGDGESIDCVIASFEEVDVSWESGGWVVHGTCASWASPNCWAGECDVQQKICNAMSVYSSNGYRLNVD